MIFLRFGVILSIRMNNLPVLRNAPANEFGQTIMEIPDLTVKHLGTPTIPSPLTGVKFIPEDATVIYGKDVHEVETELKEFGRISAFEAAGPRAVPERQIVSAGEWPGTDG